MSERIQFEPEIRTGPCLKDCGQNATYELVDPETERQRATCPNCGVYEASKDEMEDKCDAE
jgi:hypothetical protein